MTRIIYFLLFTGLIAVLSSLPACGSGNDQTEKAAEEMTQSGNQGEKDAATYGGKTEKGGPEQVKDSSPGRKAYASGSPDEILIENQVYETDRKGPVKFLHKKHYEEYNVACSKCHHVYQDGKNIWEEGDTVDKCAACHDPEEDQNGAIKLQEAYHTNCKDCHEDVSREGGGAPYRRCTACHES